MAINYEDGHAVVIQGATDFYPRFIRQMVGFFMDGKPRFFPEETMQVITILEYGKKTMETLNRWVVLPD